MNNMSITVIKSTKQLYFRFEIGIFQLTNLNSICNFNYYSTMIYEAVLKPYLYHYVFAYHLIKMYKKFSMQWLCYSLNKIVEGSLVYEYLRLGSNFIPQSQHFVALEACMKHLFWSLVSSSNRLAQEGLTSAARSAPMRAMTCLHNGCPLTGNRELGWRNRDEEMETELKELGTVLQELGRGNGNYTPGPGTGKWKL